MTKIIQFPSQHVRLVSLKNKLDQTISLVTLDQLKIDYNVDTLEELVSALAIEVINGDTRIMYTNITEFDFLVEEALFAYLATEGMFIYIPFEALDVFIEHYTSEKLDSIEDAIPRVLELAATEDIVIKFTNMMEFKEFENKFF